MTQGQVIGILYVITGALGLFLVRKQAAKTA